jgi:predicted kinase
VHWRRGAWVCWHHRYVLDLVIVNGLPGSGKTALAAELARILDASLISKDAIKEAVADVVSAGAYRALGIAASEMMWTLAAAMSGEVVMESWWFKPRDLYFVEAGLRRCGAASAVEIWCDVPAHLAKTRYAARRRHRIPECQYIRATVDHLDEVVASTLRYGRWRYTKTNGVVSTIGWSSRCVIL